MRQSDIRYAQIKIVNNQLMDIYQKQYSKETYAGMTKEQRDQEFKRLEAEYQRLETLKSLI